MATEVQRETIARAEHNIRTRLSEVDASPFLSHYVVEDEEQIGLAVKALVNGNIHALTRLFRDYPAVAIWTAAKSLANNYGEDGGNKCYEHLEQAYGLSTKLNQDQKATLRQSFRQAAGFLDLPLPADNQVIKEYGRAELKFLAPDDFFSQAGVAIHQVTNLAQIFQKAEGAFGAPVLGDTTSNLAQWERDAILEFCPTELRRLPKAILFDWSGYHAGLYARLLAGETPDTPFAKALRSAREALPKPREQFVPRLVCYDGELCIRDGSGSTGFLARLRERVQQIRRGASLPIMAPWPTSVPCWSPKVDETRARNIEILDSETSFLLFDSQSGRAIGAIDTSMSRITVPMGEIAIASRSPFTIGDCPSREAGVGAHLLYIDVLTPVTLKTSLQVVELTPRPSPSLKIQAGAAIGRSGSAPLLAGIHAVDVQFPTGGDVSLTSIEIHVSHPSMGERPTILTRDRLASATQQISLKEILPTHGEFGLLKIELKQPGVDRVLLRESAWFWPGLKSLSAGATFDAPSVPRNFDEMRSKHILANAAKNLVLEPADRVPYLAARLVFRAPDDHNSEREPLATFTFSPPGVSIIFREADGNERPLPHGQTLALSPEDGSAIIIRTSQPMARLDVKGILEQQSFDRFGVRRMTSVGLSNAMHGTSVHSEIRYQDPEHPSSWRVLLRIADVATAVRFATTSSHETVKVELTLPRTPTQIRLCGSGLLYEETFTFYENDDQLQIRRGNEDEPIHLSWHTSSLPRADVYVVAIEVDFGDGRWRRLTNARRDRFEVAVRHPQLDDATIAGRKPHSGFAIRLSDVLQRCAAEQCWRPSIESQVLPLWEREIKALADSTPPDWRTLFAAAAASRDAEASVTWIPIHHPIEGAVRLFSAPFEYFQAFDDSKDLRGGEAIGWLAHFASTDMTAASMVEQQIDRRVLAAFANFPALNRAPETIPRGFDLRRFVKAIEAVPSGERESLWTPRQGRMTESHHRWCCERYAERLSEVYVPGHNLHRTNALRELALLGNVVAQKIDGRSVVQLPCPEHLYAERRDDDRVLLEDVPRLLSLWAKHSRYGTVDQLLTAFRWDPRQTRQTRQTRQEMLQTFGFLVQLAPELFAFYLWLWEFAARGDIADA